MDDAHDGAMERTGLRSARRRKMVVTEVVILLATVLIACAICGVVLPQAMSHHYEQNRNFLASPF